MRRTPIITFADLQPDFTHYRGQFVLAKDEWHVPSGWTRIPAFSWHLAVNDLPVRQLVDKSGRDVGLCIGHPIGEGLADRLQISDAEDFYDRMGGAFILLLEGRLMLDPCGTLPAVFHTDDRIVASTPTLIPTAHQWDRSLMAALNFPQSGLWFPFAVTSRTKVRRLLPNHTLDLECWSVNRHWPTPDTDLSIRSDTQTGVARILETMAGTLRHAAHQHRLAFTLTAGRDSRMVLASAREEASQTTFETFAQPQETVDAHIATRLAARVGLKHRLLPVQQASEAEMTAWLYRTGHAIAGEIWRIHKTLDQLDPDRVLVVGVGGEVGRGHLWAKSDRNDRPIAPAELLKRISMPAHPALLEAAGRWMEPLAHRGTFALLDLLYVEQRLGCWAAPSRFGNVRSRFEFTPFNHRRVVTAMLRLPHAYRYTNQLPVDVCRLAWPALLDLPFNRLTGTRGVS
jgi:hypothetical protein